jgi:hypothetical protein
MYPAIAITGVSGYAEFAENLLSSAESPYPWHTAKPLAARPCAGPSKRLPMNFGGNFFGPFKRPHRKYS